MNHKRMSTQDRGALTRAGRTPRWLRRRGRAAVAGLALVFVAAGCADATTSDEGGEGEAAGAYPERDITFVIPYDPGGSTDPLGRTFASALAESLSAQVVPLNRSGGGGTVGMSSVVQADPDGYTIGLSDQGGLALQPHVNDSLPWDGVDDYFPLGKLTDVPGSIAVRADTPWQTFEEFVDHAKQNPGQVTIGTSGQMDITDIEAQEFARVAEIDIRTIPASGGGSEALTELLGGRVDAVNGTPATLKSVVDSGDVRVLGSFYPTPLPMFPDSVSIVEEGYDVSLPSKYGVIGPKGMPEEVKERLVTAYEEAVETEEFNTFVEENGYIADVKSSDEFRDELQSDYEQYGRLLEDLNLQ